MAAADDAHRAAQQRLSDVTTAHLARLVDALPDTRGGSVLDVYTRVAAPLVAGAQTRSAALAAGYLAMIIGTPAASPGFDPARALADVRVTAASPVAYSPILRLWYLLDNEVESAVAHEQAGSYAGELATNDLHAAQRAGLDDAAHAHGDRIVGWRKELSADACSWCRKVGADRVYRSADTVPYHPRDHCAVAPVLAADATRNPIRGYRQVVH